MLPIDFARIRSTPKSRNDSFEALAVQLFRKSCQAPQDSTFVSLRGDGGDGGVEAYFRAPDLQVIGVQAKYFFQLGTKELEQIDGSLKSARTNHPTLSEYWIYIPFDLTGRVAAGKRGKSEAERFEEWKASVEEKAEVEGAALSIVLCSAAIIRQQILAIDEHGGLRRYWFDDSILTSAQIQECLASAAAFAGPRYSAGLDVVTSAYTGLDFFGGAGDFSAWQKNTLAPPFNGLRSLMHSSNALEILGAEVSAKARSLVEAVLTECRAIIRAEHAASSVESALKSISELVPILMAARDSQEREFNAAHGKESDTPAFRQFHAEYMCTFPAANMDSARDWVRWTQNLHDVLASPILGTTIAQSLLLVGPAGAGKTHALVSAAFRRLKSGALSLVVFGEDFGRAEPWEVLRSKLGFGDAMARFTLFECLQAASEHTGFPFVIFIDALNESPRSARWKDKLPELLSQCRPYSGVKICVSVRDTFKDLEVDSRFPGIAFEYNGFEGTEFEALQEFAKYYEIDAEITPLFSAELSNPLFLHLACKVIKAEGRTSLDISLPGFTALFERHLKHCDDLVRARLNYANPRNVVRQAMLRVTDVVTQKEPQHRTWDACVAAISTIAGAEIKPEELLRELEHEGLVILSSEDDDTWLVRLGYQRYGDVLRATSLIESLDKASEEIFSVLAKKIAGFSSDDEGVLEALAILLPEKLGVEITIEDLGLDEKLAHRLFLDSLVWRSRVSMGQDIYAHARAALNAPNLWMHAYDIFFRLCLVPEHPLNARNWLSPLFQRHGMVERDAFLSIAAYKSFDANGGVRSLIESSLFAEIPRWPAESRMLATFSLAWLSSVADRRVRDQACKGLTRLLAYQPDLASDLLMEFQGCADDYIVEGIALSIYSAALLERGKAVEFVPALDRLLTHFSDYQNILVRDSIRLLGARLARFGLPDSVAVKLSDFPPKASLPERWPVLADAKPLLELERLPTDMKLWGQQLLPDFWRYQVESKLWNFDIKSAGVSNENIACWIMMEALRVGFPGQDQCAHVHDQTIVREFGSGRGRVGYAERVGKKYYWSALHRLIGIFAENVPLKKERFADWEPPTGYFWSIHLRKADLTDIRDIVAPNEYPSILYLPNFIFPPRDKDIKDWVRGGKLPEDHECLICLDEGGQEWVALELNIRGDDRSEDDESWRDPHLSVNVFYNSVFFSGDLPNFSSDEERNDYFDSNHTSCYRGYLAEYPDGIVFDQLADEGYFFEGDEKSLVSTFTLSRGGEWEYDFSFTTPERQGDLNAPCRELVDILMLQWDKNNGWVDITGTLVAFAAQAEGSSGVFIRRDSLNKYLSTIGRRLVFRRFVNRGYYTNGVDDNSQIDIVTWLLYKQQTKMDFLGFKEVPYNC
ncbi:ATP-binding protein [Chitinolyticbacter meiyuanensis]|uniref:ATP-binding protein n=1 Tax=Chitinolyticbacter meiyuanensis TaxID=682798 RepID=UPI0011E597ED|nr:ATP-binding protein [Chitinolyticbacter meiyuanensis]